MIHLTIQQLSSFLDGELAEASTELVRRHLAACEECTLRFGALEEQDEVLTRALTEDPDDEFFRSFASDVENAIQAEGPRPLAPKRSGILAPEPAAERVQTTPPRVQPTPKSARPTARHVAPAPPTRQMAYGRRSSDRQSSTPAIPWFAALILVVIAASAGVVVSRTDRVTTWLDSLGAVKGVPSAPGAASPPVASAPAPEVASQPAPKVLGQPVRGVATPAVPGVVAQPAPPPRRPQTAAPPAKAPTPAKSSFDSLPEELLEAVNAAQAASDEASTDPSAASFDDAAMAWDRVFPLLDGMPEQTLVRQRIAEARYRSWQASPDPYRAAAATAALRHYLAFAPMGRDRDEAKASLARLSH